MIIQHFDNGWGPEFPAKQLEHQLLSSTYHQLENSSRRCVVINSVWYSGDYHRSTVLPFLENNSVDEIVLISMLDAAIPQPDWFNTCAPVTALGYYPGNGFLDYWAIFLSRYFHDPHITDIARADTIDCPFMCLNRKPHWHRVQLYNHLQSTGLTQAGIVSLGGDNTAAIQTVDNDINVDNLAPNSGTEQNGIPNDISSLGKIENWQRCFFNVVTETVYDINQQYFVSEKIYKPILGMRPFAVYAPDGGQQWLLDRGFQTYYDDFRDITDLDFSQPHNLVAFLEILSRQPKRYWQKKFLELSEKLVYNKVRFEQYVQQQQKLANQGFSCQT